MNKNAKAKTNKTYNEKPIHGAGIIFDWGEMLLIKDAILYGIPYNRKNKRDFRLTKSVSDTHNAISCAFAYPYGSKEYYKSTITANELGLTIGSAAWIIHYLHEYVEFNKKYAASHGILESEVFDKYHTAIKKLKAVKRQ